ncbi:MAG TPA: fibronectin type III domain-containing protein, partial [Candidatus Acetothermia bacterium]|nr:fibronectin type III domain-containing protein [Candidatus Acetothermia bacterium]
FAGLPPPQGLTATDEEHPDKVVVTWEEVAEASSYLLYRAPAEEGTYQLLAETEDTSYEDLAVVPGTEYWYRVRACNEQGCSALSEPDSGSAGGGAGPPPPPQ